MLFSISPVIFIFSVNVGRNPNASILKNWDDCLSVAGTIPQLFICQHPFIHLGGEKQCGASSCLSHGTTNRRKQTLITDIS